MTHAPTDSLLMFKRRRLIAGAVAAGGCSLVPKSMFAQAPAVAAPTLDVISTQAASFANLRCMIIAVNGEEVLARGFAGGAPDRPTNIKSASKSIVSALVGIAIDKGLLDGPDQAIAPLLADKLPPAPDARMNDITIGHLLSMQAGLGRTSGGNYGRWIASSDWVRAALAQPFDADPGGRMLYSTGSTHLLSAILSRVGGRDAWALADDWLGMGGNFRVADWERDPQGIPLGGNQMAITPRALLAFGELYRQDGVHDGQRLISGDWISQSWEPRTNSVFSGERYGYGWFIRNMAGYDCFYAWGYGGQMLYVIPELKLTTVITSLADAPSGRSGYKDDLNAFVETSVIPMAAALPGNAAEAGAATRG
jgi:CubicO group peptidase (beta-lactamase class C family)